jgi:hypothetical protein
LGNCTIFSSHQQCTQIPVSPLLDNTGISLWFCCGSEGGIYPAHDSRVVLQVLTCTEEQESGELVGREPMKFLAEWISGVRSKVQSVMPTFKRQKEVAKEKGLIPGCPVLGPSSVGLRCATSGLREVWRRTSSCILAASPPIWRVEVKVAWGRLRKVASCLWLEERCKTGVLNPRLCDTVGAVGKMQLRTHPGASKSIPLEPECSWVLESSPEPFTCSERNELQSSLLVCRVHCAFASCDVIQQEDSWEWSYSPLL